MKKLIKEKKTPVMSSAAVMINAREVLWQDIKDQTDMSANKMEKYLGMIKKLTEQINRRTMTDDQVKKLLVSIKTHSRNYKRVAKVMKISKRSVKFILKQSKKNGKAKKETNQATQTEIFSVSDSETGTSSKADSPSIK